MDPLPKFFKSTAHVSMFDFSAAQAPLDIWSDVGSLWGCIPASLRTEEEGLNFLQILKDMKRRECSGVKTLRTISEGASRTSLRHPRGGQSLGPVTDRSHLETSPAPYVQRYITSPAPYLLPPSETRFPASLPPKTVDTRVTMGPVMERPPLVEMRTSTRTLSTAVSMEEKLRFRGATMLPSLVNPGGFDIALSLHPSEIIPLESLTVHEKISKGTFGTVWKGTFFTAGRRKTVAVKVAHRTDSYFDQEQARSLVREIEALRRVSHPNIVLFHGVVVYEARRYRRRRLQGLPFPVEHMHGAIVTDFYPNGNLFDTFFDETPIVSADRRLRIARQFVDAVRCLHSAPCRMLHRDLKTSNLILDADFSVKLCDFGKARLAPSLELVLDDNGGTPRYMAPECFAERGRINEKSDIWSVACCLVEIFGGPIPFEKHVEMSANPVDFQISPGIPKTFMPVILDLLERCFNWDASQRPSLERIARVLASVTSADIRRFKMDRKLW